MSESHIHSLVWRAFPIFKDFDDALIASLTTLSKRRTWQPGTVIFQREDTGDYMVALISGRVKLSLITPQGRELLLRQIESGSLFGEMSVLDDRPRSADATASTLCEGLVIAKKPFLHLLDTSSLAAGAVIKYLCERLRGTTDQLETIALYELKARVARFFLTTLRQIHGDDLPEMVDLKLSLSQSDIAEILGASRPKINRAIMALEESGAIQRTNHLIECNINNLLHAAEPEDYC